MSQEKSKNVEVSFTVPQEFYRLLQLVAGSDDQTIEEYVIDGILRDIDARLQGCEPECPGLWAEAGFEREGYYEPKLRAILAGGAA